MFEDIHSVSGASASERISEPSKQPYRTISIKQVEKLDTSLFKEVTIECNGVTHETYEITAQYGAGNAVEVLDALLLKSESCDCKGSPKSLWANT